MNFKSIFKIAVPIMIGNVINQIQMLIDKAFLGQVNELYLSSLGNVSTPMWASMSVCFSIVTGASIIISQKVGAEDRKDVEKYASSLLLWSNVFPIFLFFVWHFFGQQIFIALGTKGIVLDFCMDYLKYFKPIILLIGLEASTMVIMQTSNHTKPMLFFGIIRAGLNVILDYVLIFGKFGFQPMGIKGAAIATTIAEFAGVAFSMLIFISSRHMPTRPPLGSVLKASLRPYLKSSKLGLPTALEDFAWNLGNIVLIKFLNDISMVAAGIYGAILSIELIAVSCIAGVGSGTLTLCSEAVGACNIKKYKSTTLCAYIICFSIAILTLGFCLVFPKQIISIFTKETEIIAVCGLYLILMCCNLYGKSGNIILGNAIRGSGNTRWMLCTQIFGTIFISGCAFVFVKILKWGIAGVYAAVITDELVRCGINYIKYRSILKRIEIKAA